MYLIPLKPVSNQMATTVLGGQIIRVAVRQLSTGVYLTAWKDDVIVQSSILCVDRVNMMTNNYDSFVGGFVFIDSQGLESPDYTGIGTRWNLFYLESSEL